MLPLPLPLPQVNALFHLLRVGGQPAPKHQREFAMVPRPNEQQEGLFCRRDRHERMAQAAWSLVLGQTLSRPGGMSCGVSRAKNWSGYQIFHQIEMLAH